MGRHVDNPDENPELALYAADWNLSGPDRRPVIRRIVTQSSLFIELWVTNVTATCHSFPRSTRTKLEHKPTKYMRNHGYFINDNFGVFGICWTKRGQSIEHFLMSEAAQARQKNAALTALRPTDSCAASAKGSSVANISRNCLVANDIKSSFGYFSCKKSDRTLSKNRHKKRQHESWHSFATVEDFSASCAYSRY